jgi:hypothetical protein
MGPKLERTGPSAIGEGPAVRVETEGDLVAIGSDLPEANRERGVVVRQSNEY